VPSISGRVVNGLGLMLDMAANNDQMSLTSVPIPKLAVLCNASARELRNRKDTSRLTILVRFWI
jgi:hypothetical protein